MAAHKSSISKADNLEKIGEFWDKHDFADFDDLNASDVDLHITFKSADESFQQGWKETLNNEILPIEHLWDGIKPRRKK